MIFKSIDLQEYLGVDVGTITEWIVDKYMSVCKVELVHLMILIRLERSCEPMGSASHVVTYFYF